MASSATVHALSVQAADALWEHLLARQGLAPHTRLGTVEQIADAALGLHAARLPSPFGIALSRATAPGVADALFTPGVHERLVTVRCMRKTLHALPVALAGIAHAATLRFRARDAARAVLNAGVRAAALALARERLTAHLADGALHHRDLEARLVADGIGVPVARLALKTAWEEGEVVYRNTTSGWNREHRTFVLADSVPGLSFDLDRQEAITALVTAYFDRYGPATLRDATWWSGLSASDIRAALTASGRQIVALATPWADDPAFMFADRYEQFLTAEPVPTGIHLLAHEDTALKAYFQTRRRYLADLPARRAFNRIGEAICTIMSDGKVVGTWRWDPRHRAVVTTLARGRTSILQRRVIRTRAQELEGVLRRAWVAPASSAGSLVAGQLTLTGLAE